MANETPTHINHPLGGQPVFAALRDVLADLYPTEQDANVIVHDAGMVTRKIIFHARAQTNWHNILTEAFKQNCFDALLKIALHDYPNNRALRLAYDDYRRLLAQRSVRGGVITDPVRETTKESRSSNLGCSEHPIVIILGVIGSAITIFVFIIGIPSLSFFFTSWSSETPIPAPASADISTATRILTADTSTPEPPTSIPSSTSVPPSPTPVALTPTQTPSLPAIMPTPCALAVDSSIQQYWSADIGCPIKASHITWASFTPFERGFMMWRDDTRQIYGFFNGDGWEEREDKFVEGMPNRPTPNYGDAPPNLLFPIRGTGLVWETNKTFFQNLGWVRIKQKGFCAKVQNFVEGFILQVSEVGSCFDTKGQNQYSQATEPDFEFRYVIAYHSRKWLP
jgi:hypothetical protein